MSFVTNYILWRKIPGGWYVVGRKNAQKANEEYYVKEIVKSCKRLHLSPIEVKTNRCKQCLDEGHYSPRNQKLVVDVPANQKIDLKMIETFWRKKLHFPEYESGSYRTVFIIGDEIYNGKKELEESGYAYNTIRSRCLNPKAKWADHILLKVPFDY